jgi:hypothetical protein
MMRVVHHNNFVSMTLKAVSKKVSYAEAFKETSTLAISVLGQLIDPWLSNDGTKGSSLKRNITSSKDILCSYVMNLQMDHVCDAAEKTLYFSGMLLHLNYMWFLFLLHHLVLIIIQQWKLVDYKPEIC